MTELVRMENIVKEFGAVTALDGVDFSIDEGEVVGLIGDNGAGKSTLIKILAGLYPPTEGDVYIRGEKQEGHYSVGEAQDMGVTTVYQEQALGVKQNVWRNIFAGREPTHRFGFIDIGKAKEEAKDLIRGSMGFSGGGSASPNAEVGTMSGGEQQGVAISRALFFDADLVILDEPTVALSIKESEKVVDFVKELKEEGKACIYISHEIYYTYPVSDRFVILDVGKKVKEADKDEVDQDAVVDELIAAAESDKSSN